MVKGRQELYIDYLQEINKRELSGSENYDKAVLTLSSAGLGLSVALLKDVVQLDKALYLGVLYCSWLMFVLAITSTTISFIVSAKALSYQKILAERFYLKEEDEAFSAPNCYDTWTHRLNWVSGGAFVAALFLTPTFVILNLESNPMYKKASVIQVDVQRGATVPSMPSIPKPAPAPAPVPQSKG